MLDAGIIFSVDEADWISPIVIHNKKDATKIRVCIDYRSLNNACVHDPFPTPFNNEVLENVVGNEAYSFTDGFLGYHQIYLNMKKCIFAVPFGTLLGHIVCKDGVCMDIVKIAAIVHMEPPRNIRKLRATLGHMGYYKRLIKNYATIIAPMERLLKKTEEFIWTTDCQVALDKLKEMLVSAPILVHPNWNKMFPVHINASGIALGVVLA
eukprot:PITA_33893